MARGLAACGPGTRLLVFSVGGGDAERGISANLVRALDLAGEAGASVFGIVGRDGGHTARQADACVVIPPLVEERITPHTRALRGGLAPAGEPPGAAANRDQVGVAEVTPAPSR